MLRIRAACLLLVTSCARPDLQRGSEPLRATSLGAPEPLQSALPAAPSANAEPAVETAHTLDLELSSAPFALVPEALAKIDLSHAVGWADIPKGKELAGAGPVTEPSRPLAIRANGWQSTQLWVALDLFVPRRIDWAKGPSQGVLRMPWGKLAPELPALQAGTHRIVWFLTDPTGAVLARGDGAPLLGSLVFDYTPSSGASRPSSARIRAQLEQSPVVFSPRGTFNLPDAQLAKAQVAKAQPPSGGAAASPSTGVRVPFVFWANDPTSVYLLRIDGPANAHAFFRVSPGAHSLAGFESGDFTFSLGAEDSESVQEWVITVNRDLHPEQGPASP
ncbi:MAG TPA: hypothetical protein VHM70_17515 [Polyangiaceae bacterium]|nr:hypothetical protein [Polyangiaceae bacterium]